MKAEDMDESRLTFLEQQVKGIIYRNVSGEAFQWLQEKAVLIAAEQNTIHLHNAFSQVPRKTGREPLQLTAQEISNIDPTAEGFSITHWTNDRLCRMWLLMQVNTSDKQAYCKKIEGLFRDAEMHELVALYSSLDVFAYPDQWQFRTTEGIRSNIGIVLEAIMYENPYPAQYLNEPAWNQMVLKAFFTDKEVNRIIGLDERANSNLAAILVDYARERWAAGRTVNAQLWRLVSPFIDEDNFADIKKLFYNGDHVDRQAAALACYRSTYEPARQLLASESSLNTAIKENKLNWQSVNAIL